jgi:hypothetical protein
VWTFLLSTLHTYVYIRVYAYIFFPWHYIPSGPRPTSMNSVHFGFSRSYTYCRTPWAGDQLVARPLPADKHRKTHTNIHALSGIGTHDPGFPASEDSACLRPLGYRGRPYAYIYSYILWYVNPLLGNTRNTHGWSSIFSVSVQLAHD